jgi:arsenite methyltransferase
VTDDALVETLQAHYGAAARRAARGEAAARDGGAESGTAAASCSPGVEACCGRGAEPQPTVFGSGLYGTDELAQLPAEAVAGSIGCANPVALAQLTEGEVVLDLGSGGGIDVLLSARRVGPTGKAYGVDMTPEMLELARANQVRAGVENVEFLEGRIEAVPLPDASVDVVVSNCVVNLSADKGAVFGEAYRVLRPGGRLAIADVIAEIEPDAALRSDREAWASCIAGAVTRAQYTATLTEAGFVDVEITDSHEVQDGFWSVLVRATKP